MAHSNTVWGTASAFLDHARKIRWIDLLIVASLAGMFYGLLMLQSEWTSAASPAKEPIDLSPWALPKYTLYSLSRGLIAYLFSLAFTLAYGYWAAKDHMAEHLLVPMLDILQSIPVLGFMPGLVIALVALFPNSHVGLELAAILMIFTGQAWNMTFSFYHSLRSIPKDMNEVGSAYHFSAWERLKWIELPFSAIGLVWNSMMSMAGGWFFLMINEAFTLGDRDFRLPGIGSYMSVAVEQDDKSAMFWALLAMVLMIVFLDQFLWRPLVVWSRKFRIEEGGARDDTSSWVLDLLRRSWLVARVAEWQARRQNTRFARSQNATRPVQPPHGGLRTWLATLALLGLVAVLLYGAWRLALMLLVLPAGQWTELGTAALLTLGRVLLATALGTLWALPAGLAIGLNPRLSRILQPVIQVVASFPAPMLFPIAIAVFNACGLELGWGSIVLMLLGTQWYILFNVVAGTLAIPHDLQEAAQSYRLSGWMRFKTVYLPAVFPYLVTGWVTAAGGAWNASIVSEYVTFQKHTDAAWGLGSTISIACAQNNFPLLAASVLTMSLVVVIFNRLVWRRLYHLAETRYSLSK
ncbi:MAG: ABC transporter permease subunit [Planctomycetes bacterium]|nr:ABC transporter permease subunit [Planctomycetota bacterium]